MKNEDIKVYIDGKETDAFSLSGLEKAIEDLEQEEQDPQGET